MLGPVRSINVGPGERRVPDNGDVGLCRRCLGLARLLFGLALEHLQALALPAVLGKPNAAPVVEVGRLLLLRRPSQIGGALTHSRTTPVQK